MRAVLTAVFLAALVVPSATDASVWSQQVTCKPKLKRDYRQHYRKVRHRLGRRAPGRQILKHGVRFKGVTFVATCGELRQSRGQLEKLLVAPPVMYSTAVPPQQPPAAVKTDFNKAALPSCTWAPESGGNYGAVNPSSGAYGKYQVIPSTWAAHCSDLGRDPSGQEECAARIWAAQGSGAWVNC